MLITLCPERRKLQSEIFADTYNGKRSVLAFVCEAQNICIEIDARREVVGVEYQMINPDHEFANRFLRKFLKLSFHISFEPFDDLSVAFQAIDIKRVVITDVNV